MVCSAALMVLRGRKNHYSPQISHCIVFKINYGLSVAMRLYYRRILRKKSDVWNFDGTMWTEEASLLSFFADENTFFVACNNMIWAIVDIADWNTRVIKSEVWTSSNGIV